MAWSEKETATLAAAIVAAAGAVVVALINRKKPKSEISIPAQPPVSPPSPRPVVAHSPAGISPPPRRPLSDLTHGAIRAQLENLTPFHRDTVEKSYVGFRVRWRIILHSLGEIGDKAHLFGDVAETKTAIECNGDKGAFASLIHAADGEEIEIEGTIDMVGTAFTILNDCVPRRFPVPTED